MLTWAPRLSVSPGDCAPLIQNDTGIGKCSPCLSVFRYFDKINLPVIDRIGFVFSYNLKISKAVDDCSFKRKIDHDSAKQGNYNSDDRERSTNERLLPGHTVGYPLGVLPASTE